MKRILYTLLVLIAGAGLGGGGLYIATHWDKFNPFQAQDTKEPLQRLLAGLRKSCATDPALKGAVIKSADIADGKLALRGLVASKEQLALLDSRGQALLADTPELQTLCSSGVSTDGLKVLPILDQLAALQRDFDEARGADSDDEQDALKRQVMRTTRLDAVAISEDGKLTFTGVCIRGDTGAEATSNALRSALGNRLEAMGLNASLMPDLALDVKYFTNPAVALQRQFGPDPRARGIQLISATYDAKGKLHVTGLIADDGQRKLVADALEAYAKAPLTIAVVKSPAAAVNFTHHLEVFQTEARLLELQKQLVEHARKENKPHLRRVRLEQILPTAIQDAKKQIATDDEANVLYYFRVKGRLYETAGEREQIETELKTWLIEQLPKVLNSDRKPMTPHFELVVKESPIFAMQKRIVARGLDGAVFTDALFDEKGQLEVIGRAHQPDDVGRQALADAVKDLLAKEPNANLQAVKAHATAQQALPITWINVVHACQVKLAQDSGLGQRLRVDRLYFNYENQQLRLIGTGAFLADMPMENTDGALRKAIDDVIASRGPAYVKSSGVKHLKNPLAELQDLAAERADLDGVLFTNLRYGPDGSLQIAGYLGAAEHRPALAPIVAQRLQKNPAVLKSDSDPKISPGWSIDAMKPHAAAKGDLKWQDLLHACQADLATAPDPLFRRACLSRAYFKYAEVKPSEKDARLRHLTLQCQTTHLTKPQDDAAVRLKQMIEEKIAGAGKRLLAEVPIDQVHADLRQIETPIHDLQKLAVVKSYDGILFQDAYFGPDGKLIFDGIRGNADQLKLAKDLVDQLLADKEKEAIAPVGLAPLDRMKLVAWQPMLDDIRGHFAQDKASLFKQTRIDRAYFQYDKTGTKALLHFKGISIYQGKVLMPEQQRAGIADKLKKHLAVKGIDEFELDLGDIGRKGNPVLEMQKKANDNQWDGVVFGEIGFDAKGVCYVKLPFPPKGQEENIRKLIAEFSKKYPHLEPIQQH